MGTGSQDNSKMVFDSGSEKNPSAGGAGDDAAGQRTWFWGGSRIERFLSVMKRKLSEIPFVITVSVAILGLAGIYMLVRPGPGAAKERYNAGMARPNATEDKYQQNISGQDTIRDEHVRSSDTKRNRGVSSLISREIAEKLDKGVSWELAERLYAQGNYNQACYVFSRLCENTGGGRGEKQYIRDMLCLKQVLCLEKTGEGERVPELLVRALSSGSPYVRASANYILMQAEWENGQYLAARKSAYKAAGLYRVLGEKAAENETYCFFMAAQSLTEYLLSLNNRTGQAGGSIWPEPDVGVFIKSAPEGDVNGLEEILSAGAAELEDNSISPCIRQRRIFAGGGVRYYAYVLDGPVDEFFARFASESNCQLRWEESTRGKRKAAVALCMPGTSEQMVAEVAAGAAGLIARFEDNNIHIYNPESYDDLSVYKQLLAREAVASWRRFLMRYSGDRRCPYAHYALAVLFDMEGQVQPAISECKLTANRYSGSAVAPYALLISSRIKTDMRDYAGASADLNELLTQYPDFKLVDTAMLYLAKASVESGSYERAIRNYTKVYNTGIDRQMRAEAAMGLGSCYYRTGQYADASRWLEAAVELSDNSDNSRLGSAWFMLGKARTELKDYRQAAIAMKNAAARAGRSEDEEYVGAVLGLAEAQKGLGSYVEALNSLENIPVARLSQESACHVTTAKAQLYREIGLPETAITMLKRKTEFIVKPELRAVLSVELARCYIQTDDSRGAKAELVKAVQGLPAGGDLTEAKILLAELYGVLGEHEQSRRLCESVLDISELQEGQRQKVLKVLGKAYSSSGQPDKAAMAYAGIYEKRGVEK